MREAIGGTWLFGLVITFIVFFASFLAVSINYSKAFNVKNNIVDLIGKYEGNNCWSRKKINEYLYDVGYLVVGDCNSIPGAPAGYYKAYNIDGSYSTSSKGYYCIAEDETEGDSVVIVKKYYRVVVFFKIDLPLVGNLTSFPIKGETESIYFAKDVEPHGCP